MQITRNAALNQVNEYFVGWTRPVIIFNSRKFDDNFLTVFFSTGPVPAVLQGSTGVPGELWPLCNVTTPTEHLPRSDLSGVCQVSHLSRHPITWSPPVPAPTPLQTLSPRSYRRGGERDELADPLTVFIHHRDTRRVNQPPEIFLL